tara:strand:+ start:261 stop:512 length:252 start_codon:yes stop_codon:yes gene_type:complete
MLIKTKEIKMEFKKDIFLADSIVGEHDVNNVWFKTIQGTNRLDENVMIHKMSNKEFFLIDETTNKQFIRKFKSLEDALEFASI